MSAAPVDSFDAAIVLGAMARPDGSPSPAMARRVAHAVRLAAEGRVDRLVMSGGPVGHPISEARIMRDLALRAGIAADRIVLEERALNTIGNALHSRPLVEEHGWRRLLVVTDSCHMVRALYAFHRLGLPVRPSSAGSRGGSPPARAAHWLRELLFALPWTVIRVERRLWRRGKGNE